jgi:hypothetical protein
VASPRVYQLVFKVIAIMFYEHIKGIRCLSPVDEMTIIFHMTPGGLRTFACTNLLIKIKYIFLGQNEKRIKKIRFPVKDSNPRPTVNISRLKSAVNVKGPCSSHPDLSILVYMKFIIIFGKDLLHDL